MLPLITLGPFYPQGAPAVGCVGGVAHPSPPTAVVNGGASLMFSGVNRLFSLAGQRTLYRPANMARLRAKFFFLMQNDRESVRFIDRIAQGLRDPDSPEVGRLIGVVHKTEARLRTWPARIARRGPVAALYHFHGSKSREIGHLIALMRNPHTVEVQIRPEDGAYTVRRSVLAPRLDLRALVDRHPVLGRRTPEDRKAVEEFLKFLKEKGTAKDHGDFESVVQRLGAIASYDPPSFRDFLDLVRDPKSFVRSGGHQEAVLLLRLISRTARFLRSWRGRVAWYGSPFQFFLMTRDDPRAYASIHNRLTKGTVGRVIFQDGGILFESSAAARHPSRMSRTPYDYRKASKIHFLPSPENNWGEKDFVLPEEELRREIRLFFERLERKLKVATKDIRLTLKIPYHFIRSARTAMKPAYLADRFLDRLELTEREKERLRHLQTLLAVARDFAAETERGPYWRQGRLLRYYRLLHQVPLSEVRPVYRGEYAIEDASYVELGRVSLAGLEKIREAARAVGVPAFLEDAFVEHVSGSYESVRHFLAGGSEAPVTAFPNPAWAVPYEDRSQEEMIALLKAAAREIRGPRTQRDMARAVGVTFSRVLELENFCTLAPETLFAYERFLRRSGRAEEGWRLRVMRAVLETKYKPLPDRTGYFRAGRLLRFLRAMMPGTTIERLVGELQLGIPPLAYTRWEWGFTRMPSDVVQKYTALLKEEGILSPAQAGRLHSWIETVYSRAR